MLDQLSLLDWKRQVFALYAAVRAIPDPAEAWRRWREARDELFATHAQSPLPEGARFASVRFELRGEPGELELYWLEGYGSGVFLPFADATSGDQTYGAGRYLLDTVKGADLGADGGQLVLDFNFAYNPSCSYDPAWVCPLAPPPNRLAFPVSAGERHDSQEVIRQ